jgi:hypothetical protein
VLDALDRNGSQVRQETVKAVGVQMLGMVTGSTIGSGSFHHETCARTSIHAPSILGPSSGGRMLLGQVSQNP